MKTIKLMTLMMAALATTWGCSSDSNDNEEQWSNSTFAPSAQPTWAVDWTSTATAPDWKNPDPTRFDGPSMSFLVDLDEELTRNSTSEDIMAAFINNECRGVSRRHEWPNGSVSFLLTLKGSGIEAKKPVELRYYCDKLHHMNTVSSIMQFVPGNILNKDYMTILNISDGSSKYPVKTLLTIKIPQKTPFTVNSGDMLAVFVGDECRGVGSRNADANDCWQVTTYSVQAGETAQIRYYSSEKVGIYTILKTFELEGDSQQENILF